MKSPALPRSSSPLAAPPTAGHCQDASDFPLSQNAYTATAEPWPAPHQESLLSTKTAPTFLLILQPQLAPCFQDSLGFCSPLSFLTAPVLSHCTHRALGHLLFFQDSRIHELLPMAAELTPCFPPQQALTLNVLLTSF